MSSDGVRIVKINFLPIKVPDVIRCAICKNTIHDWNEKIFYKKKEVHRRCKPKQKIVIHDQKIRLKNCRHCGKELLPHKHLYCSSDCGWRFKLKEKRLNEKK